jgi:hypothetical protein
MFRKIFIVAGKRIPYRYICLFHISACGKFLKCSFDETDNDGTNKILISL